MSDLDQPDPSGIAPGSQRSVQRSILFSAVERYGNLVLFLVTSPAINKGDPILSVGTASSP